MLGPVARAAYLLYFASHIPITLLIDAQAAIDHRHFPEPAQALLDWHIRVNGDILMGAPALVPERRLGRDMPPAPVLLRGRQSVV